MKFEQIIIENSEVNFKFFYFISNESLVIIENQKFPFHDFSNLYLSNIPKKDFIKNIYIDIFISEDSLNPQLIVLEAKNPTHSNFVSLKSIQTSILKSLKDFYIHCPSIDLPKFLQRKLNNKKDLILSI